MAEQKEGGLKELLPGLLSELLPAQIAPVSTEHLIHEQQPKEGDERGGSEEQSWDEQRWREKQQAQDEQQEGVRRQKAEDKRAANSTRAQSMGEESVGRFGQLLPENAEAEAMLEGTNELIEDQQEHAREEEEQPQTEEQQLQEFLRQMDVKSGSQSAHRTVEDDVQGDIQCTECRTEARGLRLKPSADRRAELPLNEKATATLHVALRNAKCAFTCAEKTLADLQDLTNMYAEKAGTSPQALGFEADLLLPPYTALKPSEPLGALGGRGLFGLMTNLVSLPVKGAVATACAVATANEYVYEVSVDFLEVSARAGFAILSAAAGRARRAARRRRRQAS